MMNQRHANKLLSHATIIAVFSILSKILGLVRDRLLASGFGAGEILDAYYAAFRIPDFLFNLLVLGTVSAAFVPVFLSYVNKKKTEEAFSIANSVLNNIFILMIIVGVVAFIFAEPLLKLIAPGFTDPHVIELTLQYMRWMLLSPVLFGISSVLSGILNAYRRFVAYSLAPVFYNLGIILGITILVPLFGPVALAWGVVLGALLHLIVQIPGVFRSGYRWRPEVSWKHEGFRKIIKLMLPRMVGFAALQISLLVTVAIATTLKAGSTTVYNLALNLQYFPVTVFGISLATAVFPVLATAASEQDVQTFRDNFSLSFRKILFFIIPVSVLMIILRAQIVRIILGTGAFDWEDTILTLETLGFFALSLFAQALIPLLTRSFYAIQNTKTPVVIGIFSMAVNIGFSFALAPKMGVAGLALAFSIASLFNATALLIYLRRTIGNLDDNDIVSSAFKTIFASLIMGLVSYGLLYAVAAVISIETYLGIITQASVSVLGGIVAFIIVLALLKSPELQFYSKLIKKRKKS